MGLFNRNKKKEIEAKHYMEEMRKQAEVQVVRKVEQLVLMKQLVPEAKALAEDLGITQQEALIYLKAKEGIKENGNKQQPGAGFDWSGLMNKLGDMGDYGGDMQKMGTNLMNIGLGSEDIEGTPNTSRGRGQRKTKRTY